MPWPGRRVRVRPERAGRYDGEAMSRSPSFAGALLCALCAATVWTVAAESAVPAQPRPLVLAQAGQSKPAADTSQSPQAKPAAARSSAPSTPASKNAAPKATTTRPKTPPPKAASKKNELQQIDWRELLPANERKRYDPNPPPPVHGPLGEAGPPAVQTVTTTVNAELDQALVRLPGFIVPLGPPRDGVVREFYLVPYIGEDIHVPPPPSNQMVYVRSATGIAAEALHEAYWVTGKMRVETRTTPLGTSAYSMVASKVEQYLN
jgi:hypothetical protein